MKATSLAYRRFGENLCGHGLLLYGSRNITAVSRLPTNIQAVSYFTGQAAEENIGLYHSP